MKKINKKCIASRFLTKSLCKKNRSFQLEKGDPSVCGGTPVVRNLSSPEACPSFHYYSTCFTFKIKVMLDASYYCNSVHIIC